MDTHRTMLQVLPLEDSTHVCCQGGACCARWTIPEVLCWHNKPGLRYIAALAAVNGAEACYACAIDRAERNMLGATTWTRSRSGLQDTTWALTLAGKQQAKHQPCWPVSPACAAGMWHATFGR